MVYARAVLVATSEARLGGSSLRSTLLFERAIRGAVVERRGLTFDTRFAAAAAGEPDAVGHLFLMLRGTLDTDRGERFTGPLGVVLADDEWERPGRASRTFRTSGEIVDVVQLRIARDQLLAPVGLGAGPLAMTPACWDACAALHDQGPRGEASSLSGLLGALAAARIVSPALTATVIGEEPERFRRMWAALRPLFQTHGATTSLKQLADSLGLSMRQVGRDAKELSTAFGIASGYRDALLVIRLRQAVLMLSAPGATVAEVARLVGYGSPIALARAFRDARLPPPSAIQAALRGEASPPAG